MAYDLEVRREAIRLATEEGYLGGPPTRTSTTGWSIGRVSSVSKLVAPPDQPMKTQTTSGSLSWRKNSETLSWQVQNARSRSPRGNKNQKSQLALSAPSQLAHPASPAQKAKVGKGKGKGKKNKGRGRGTTTGQSVRSLTALMDLPRSQRPQFTAAKYSFPGVCYAFQSNTCTNSPCSRAHVCICESERACNGTLDVLPQHVNEGASATYNCS